MTPLFLLSALLLLVSGLVKLRTGFRAELGLHLPSLVEVLAGLCLPVVAMGRTLSAGVGLATLVVAFLILVWASVHLAARLRRRNRFRERTEGRRLETYLRYLSDQENSTP